MNWNTDGIVIDEEKIDNSANQLTLCFEDDLYIDKDSDEVFRVIGRGDKGVIVTLVSGDVDNIGVMVFISSKHFEEFYERV